MAENDIMFCDLGGTANARMKWRNIIDHINNESVNKINNTRL